MHNLVWNTHMQILFMGIPITNAFLNSTSCLISLKKIKRFNTKTPGGSEDDNSQIVIISSTIWYWFARKIPFGRWFWQNNDTLICIKNNPGKRREKACEINTKIKLESGEFLRTKYLNVTLKCQRKFREYSLTKDFYVRKQLLNSNSSGITKIWNELWLYPSSFVLTVL